jgi:hypothetical protein
VEPNFLNITLRAAKETVLGYFMPLVSLTAWKELFSQSLKSIPKVRVEPEATVQKATQKGYSRSHQGANSTPGFNTNGTPIFNTEVLRETEPVTSVVNTMWQIVFHISLVTASFTLIFGLAILLNFSIRFLESGGYIKANTPIIWALYGLKYLIIFFDLAFLLVSVYGSTRKAIQKL